jgi:hypothetical protein
MVMKGGIFNKAETDNNGKPERIYIPPFISRIRTEWPVKYTVDTPFVIT